MTTETTIKDLPALPPTERAAIVLKSESVAAELTALVEASASITAITSADGRTECHAAAMKAKAARVSIEKAGKDARDDANAFSKAVIAEEKRLVAIIEPEQNRLLALRDGWDAKIEAEKEAQRKAEAEKAAAITRKIDAIKNIPLAQVGKTSDEIRAALKSVKEIEIDDSYGDQFGAAKEARGDVILKLIDMADAAEEREAAEAIAAEERRIAAEKAERERIEREAEAQRQREEAERIRAEAERQRAENEAAAAKLKAEREEFEKQQAEARAKIEREQRFAEAKMIADEELAKAAQKRADDEAAAKCMAPIIAAEIAARSSDTPEQAAPTAPVAASVTPIDNGARINLATINLALSPLNVSSSALALLGIEQAGKNGTSVLYRESDLPRICEAIAAHCLRVADGFASKREAA